MSRPLDDHKDPLRLPSTKHEQSIAEMEHHLIFIHPITYRTFATRLNAALEAQRSRGVSLQSLLDVAYSEMSAQEGQVVSRKDITADGIMKNHGGSHTSYSDYSRQYVFAMLCLWAIQNGRVDGMLDVVKYITKNKNEWIRDAVFFLYQDKIQSSTRIQAEFTTALDEAINFLPDPSAMVEELLSHDKATWKALDTFNGRDTLISVVRKINSSDNPDQTKKWFKTAESLLRSGIAINKKGSEKFNPLSQNALLVAISNPAINDADRLELVKLLLRYGGDPELIDRNNLIAFDYVMKDISKEDKPSTELCGIMFNLLKHGSSASAYLSLSDKDKDGFKAKLFENPAHYNLRATLVKLDAYHRIFLDGFHKAIKHSTKDLVTALTGTLALIQDTHDSLSHASETSIWSPEKLGAEINGRIMVQSILNSRLKVGDKEYLNIADYAVKTRKYELLTVALVHGARIDNHGAFDTTNPELPAHKSPYSRVTKYAQETTAFGAKAAIPICDQAIIARKRQIESLGIPALGVPPSLAFIEQTKLSKQFDKTADQKKSSDKFGAELDIEEDDLSVVPTPYDLDRKQKKEVAGSKTSRPTKHKWQEMTMDESLAYLLPRDELEEESEEELDEEQSEDEYEEQPTILPSEGTPASSTKASSWFSCYDTRETEKPR